MELIMINQLEFLIKLSFEYFINNNTHYGGAYEYFISI